MTNCVIYSRFSPRRNAAESESCETQEAYARKYVAERSYTVAGVFEDKAVSGADEYRPTLWAAIEALERGSVLVVYKLDRLARNVYLAECIRRAVEAKHGTIEAVQGDVEGNGAEHVMIRQVLAAIAEYERKIIAQRTKWAMLHHQKQGRRMGRYAPYGWRIDPNDSTRLEPVHVEQEAIECIGILHGDGKRPAEIVRELNKSEYKPRGVKWSQKTVSKIIERM